MQGPEVWTSAPRGREWGLFGFREPHWTRRKIQGEGGINLRRENGRGPVAFYRSDFKVERLSVLHSKILLNASHLCFIPI